MVATLQSQTPKWNSVPDSTRLIVVSTDSGPHFEGDGYNVYGIAPFAGVFDEPQMDQQCLTEYYPTVRLIGDGLFEMSISA